MTGFLWRAYHINWFDEVKVIFEPFPIRKRTPCGAWIYLDVQARSHFVNLKANRKFAHETREKALESFIRRRAAIINILEDRLADAQEALKTAHEMRLDPAKHGEKQMIYGWIFTEYPQPAPDKES